MSVKVIMPQLGETVVEGTITQWLVKEGDRVIKDQSLVAISTDKAEVEIPSPMNGILTKILIEEGKTVPIGTELAIIEEEKAAPSPQPAPVEKKEPHSPLVRRLAKEKGVDLTKVKGTGEGGRITKEDILKYLETQKPAEKEAVEEAKEEKVEVKEPESKFTIPKYQPKEGDKIIPFTRIRKNIAEHMTYSKRTSAHVTSFTEVDMEKIVRLHKENKELSYIAFVTAAVVSALKEFPVLNSSVVDDNIVIKKEINIGIAVDTERGLTVPVIAGADKKSVLEIAKEIQTLAEKVRGGRLSPNEISGGTFTITNPGVKGNLFGTPIINQPQAAILRIGEIIKRPVVKECNGEDVIAVTHMMYLSLSYDHRIIDGVTGNNFLHRIKEILEKGEFVTST